MPNLQFTELHGLLVVTLGSQVRWSRGQTRLLSQVRITLGKDSCVTSFSMAKWELPQLVQSRLHSLEKIEGINIGGEYVTVRIRPEAQDLQSVTECECLVVEFSRFGTIRQFELLY